jgi:hypothetical protein
VKAGLSTASHADTRREVAAHGPSHRKCAVDETVAALEADNSSSKVSIQVEPPRHRPLIDAAFKEEGKSIASAPPLASEPLPALGVDPDRQANERLDTDAAGHFGPATADLGVVRAVDPR